MSHCDDACMHNFVDIVLYSIAIINALSDYARDGRATQSFNSFNHTKAARTVG
jgi:hypothetical protein